MASDDEAGKTRRFTGGPRPVGSVLPAITRPAFRSRSAAGAQLMADWHAIMGPALAGVTFPRQLTSGTLTLVCSGPIALELQHLTGPLMERINAHFGRVVVERFRFVQGAGGTPAAPAPKRARKLAPVAVPGMPPGELHDALAALGAAIAAQGTRE